MTVVPGVGGMLLTGGASVRLGTDKARLVLGDRTLAHRAADVLRSVATPLVEVGPGHSELSRVTEAPPGGGPLAAVVAGFGGLAGRGHSGPVLVLAVDMPEVTPTLLEHLARRPGPRAQVPVADGRAQPLCARYPARAAAIAAELLAAGDRSMQALLAALDVEWVPRSEWGMVAGPYAFADVDTPEDALRSGVIVPGRS